jgi:predicted signal transduction protein with EAL and GGDEF domain
MRNADTAMYRAKDAGRGCVMFFDPQLSAGAHAATESGLQRALRRREFSLFFQPQFAVTDGGLTGVEALLRWQTPRDGMRPPGEFVPAAEESGLIVDIGGWVLDAACAQLAQWREQNIAPPRLALNDSAQQLKHVDFAKLVRRALDKHGIPPALLPSWESTWRWMISGPAIPRSRICGSIRSVRSRSIARFSRKCRKTPRLRRSSRRSS